MSEGCLFMHEKVFSTVQKVVAISSCNKKERKENKTIKKRKIKQNKNKTKQGKENKKNKKQTKKENKGTEKKTNTKTEVRNKQPCQYSIVFFQYEKTNITTDKQTKHISPVLWALFFAQKRGIWSLSLHLVGSCRWTGDHIAYPYYTDLTSK